MADITTSAGSRFFIGPAILSTVVTVGAFAALTYVEVGLIETFGEFGDQANDVAFTAVNDARVRHAKGSRDAGTMQLTVGHDPFDAGQLAMIAAEATVANYAFKVMLNDGPTGSAIDTVAFFRGLVQSRKLNIGGNDAVIRRMFNIGINSTIYEVPSVLV